MTTDTTAALIAKTRRGADFLDAVDASKRGERRAPVSAAEFGLDGDEDIQDVLRALADALESVGVEATTPHEAWDEGYRHGYIIGCEEGATGIVVEYVAPNPYPAPVTAQTEKEKP